MPLFRSQKKAASILPGDIVQKMELYGRFEIAPQQADPSAASRVGELLPRLYRIAQADPDAFITALAGAVLPHGGWAVYGGERCVKDVVDMNSRHPGFLQMIDAAMTFLRSQGYGPGHIAPYEMQAWRELHPGEEWQGA
jgi:hypothetical protein